VVDVGKPFIVGPPQETINCRCRSITVIPEIGPLETPLDAEIEAEKERRAKDEAEKAAKKAQKAEPTPVRREVPQNTRTKDRAIDWTEQRYSKRDVDRLEYLNSQIASEGVVSMRVPESALRQIADDGHFKNQYAVRRSRGMFDPDGRMTAEQTMFGIPRNSEPEDYPVYGYIRAPDGDARVGGYGRIRVTFKESVRNGTSFTYGDSLSNGRAGNVSPAPVTRPHIGNPASDFEPVFSGVRKRASLKDNMESIQVSYAEAQIHGRLALDDIEKIEWPPGSLPSVELENYLASRGIDPNILGVYSQ
jgi:hypothetical protein